MGDLYFLVKGVWIHAIASFILVFVTFGISWLIYPIWAPILIVRSYQRKGWVELDHNGEALSEDGQSKSGSSNEKSKHTPAQAPASAPKQESKWDGERDLNSMPYKLFLSKKYEINKNELFEKYFVGDTAHDTLDDALKYADSLERQS